MQASAVLAMRSSAGGPHDDVWLGSGNTEGAMEDWHDGACLVPDFGAGMVATYTIVSPSNAAIEIKLQGTKR